MADKIHYSETICQKNHYKPVSVLNFQCFRLFHHSTPAIFARRQFVRLLNFDTGDQMKSCAVDNANACGNSDVLENSGDPQMQS